MKKALRIISYVSAFSAMAGLCFLLCLWFYSLGESEAIPLGTSYEEFLSSVAEQSRLGHLVRVEEGEIDVFVEGERYSYHLLSASERIANALRAALSLDYGQAIIEPTSVKELLIPTVLPSVIAVILSLLGGIVPLFLPLAKKRWSFLLGALLCLGASIGSSFLPFPYLSYVFVAFMGGLLLLAWRKEKKGNLRKSLLISFLCLSLLFFFGALSSNVQSDIASLSWYGIRGKDNHLYAVSLFFTLFIPMGLLGLSGLMSLYHLLEKRKALAIEER
ncbi:MAG: hypothetical protein IJ787_02795 [Bacilli bacterium]|nr:hypothetical protein [Bacilli bacterium]